MLYCNVYALFMTGSSALQIQPHGIDTWPNQRLQPQCLILHSRWGLKTSSRGVCGITACRGVHINGQVSTVLALFSTTNPAFPYYKWMNATRGWNWAKKLRPPFVNSFTILGAWSGLLHCGVYYSCPPGYVLSAAPLQGNMYTTCVCDYQNPNILDCNGHSITLRVSRLPILLALSSSHR